MLTRRQALQTGIAAGAGLTLGAAAPGWARKRPAPLARGGAFTHGVASGLPRRSGISLWTRLDEAEGPSRLEVEIATDPGFRRVVERRRITADPGADFTAQLRVQSKRLRPAQNYFYRFETATAQSPVGHFRTLPPRDSAQPVRIGFWTCQHFEVGHYAAHAALAREDLDLVVCLGDYIYEYGDKRLPDRRDETGANRDGNAETLEDYRAKYRLYRTDERLRALHESHAFVYLWDDHEVVNNYWRDGAAGKTIEGFAARRSAAYRAWFEHQPVPRLGGPAGTRIHRSVRVGRNVDLFLIDDRQYRDAQPCGDSNLVPCPDAGTKGRTMLGAEQKAWLKDGMRRTTAPWKVLANGDMLMALDTPVRGAPKFVDTWDGYAAEREELVTHWLREGIRDVVVMTGDDHDNYAGVVTTTGRDDGVPGAVEFVVPSVTSDNTNELLQGAPGAALLAEGDTRAVNPHLALVDQVRHGYCVLEASSGEVRVDFKHVADRADPRSQVSTTYRMRVPRGRPVVERV